MALRNSESLNAVYKMHSIDSSAFSLVGIFIPIYLLTLGFSVTEVLVYFIIQNTTLLMSAFAVGYIGSKYGIQRAMLLRLPFLFLFLILLLLLDNINFPIYLLAIIDGWQSALYWIPLNIAFTKNANKRKMGSALGGLFAWPKVATIFTPMFGGLIASYFGFNALFAITLIIFAFSVIPLLRIKKIKIDFHFKFKEGLKLYRKNKKYFWAEVFNNIGEETDGIIWPIFIYLSLVKITAVGNTATIISLGAFFLTLYMGRISDKAGKEVLIKVGASLIMLTWFIRIFFDTEIAFYIIALFSGLAFVIFKIPYYSKLFSIPRKSKVDEFFIFREVPVNIARIIVFLLAIIFVNNLQFLFPIAGLVYLYFLLFKL
ncbi:MFS transporter [Candidatus Parcubacteria bacterium]|nr:MFS transporter [Candidatus Parcubacteria bacterium]